MDKKRILIPVVIVVAVLIFLIVSVLRPDMPLHGLLTGEGSGAPAEEITFEVSSGNAYAAFGDGFLLASNNKVRYVLQDGTEVFTRDVSLQSPCIDVSDSAAVVYDLGGSLFCLFDREGFLGEKRLEGERKIYSANVNDKGYLAITMQEAGYKALVSVYDSKMKELFQWHSSAQYVVNAQVSKDGRRVTAVAVGQSGSRFESRLVTYRLDQETPEVETAIPDNLILELGSVDGDLCALGDNSIHFFSGNGKEEKSSWYYGDGYLRKFSLDADAFAVLAVNKYKAGNWSQLTTLNTDGEILGSFEVNEEIRDLAAAGRRVAILYEDRLSVCNSALEELACLENVAGVKEILLREDGTVLLIGSGNVRFWRP